MAKSWEKPWSIEEIVENAPKWTLAGDVALLKTLEDFSEKLLTKAEVTHNNVDNLLNDLNESSIKLDLVKNEFLGLQNTQFIESRVYEDDETLEITNEEKSEKKESETETKEAMKSAVLEGLKILDKYYEKVSVPASDSEDDEVESNCVLRMKDPYITRPLPYLIGTKEWYDKWHVGLLASSSEDEEEEIEEKYSDTDSESNLPVTDRRGISTSDSGTDISNQVEKPVANSTFNDTMASTDSEEYNNSIPSKPPISHLSFAEQLAARLSNVDVNKEQEQVVVNKKPIQKSALSTRIIGDILSDEPPPLDDTEDDLFGGKSSQGMFSGGDGLFDNSDDDTDYFGKQKVLPTTKINSSSKPSENKVPNLFDDNEEEGMFSQKDNVGENKNKKAKPTPRGLFSDEDSDDDDLFSSTANQQHHAQPSYMKSTINAIPFIPDEPPELTPKIKSDSRNLHSAQSNTSDYTEKSSTSGDLEADNKLLINAKQKSRKDHLLDEMDKTQKSVNLFDETEKSTRKTQNVYDKDNFTDKQIKNDFLGISKKDQLFGDPVDKPKDDLFDDHPKSNSRSKDLFNDFQQTTKDSDLFSNSKKVGLFDDPGDLFKDDLFSDAIFSTNHVRKEDKEKKKLKLFDDEEDNIFGRSHKNNSIFGGNVTKSFAGESEDDRLKNVDGTSKNIENKSQSKVDSTFEANKIGVENKSSGNDKSTIKENKKLFGSDEDLFQSENLFNSTTKEANKSTSAKSKLFDTPEDDLFGETKQTIFTPPKLSNLFDSPVKSDLFDSPMKSNLFDSPTKDSTVNDNLFDSHVQQNENVFETNKEVEEKLTERKVSEDDITIKRNEEKQGDVKIKSIIEINAGQQDNKIKQKTDLPSDDYATNNQTSDLDKNIVFNHGNINETDCEGGWETSRSKDFLDEDSTDEDDLFASKPPLQKMLEKKNEYQNSKTVGGDNEYSDERLSTIKENEFNRHVVTSESPEKIDKNPSESSKIIKSNEKTIIESSVNNRADISSSYSREFDTSTPPEVTDIPITIEKSVENSVHITKPTVPVKKPSLVKKEMPAFSLISDTPPDIDWDQKSDANISDDEDMFDDIPVPSQKASIFDKEPPALDIENSTLESSVLGERSMSSLFDDGDIPSASRVMSLFDNEPPSLDFLVKSPQRNKIGVSEVKKLKDDQNSSNIFDKDSKDGVTDKESKTSIFNDQLKKGDLFSGKSDDQVDFKKKDTMNKDTGSLFGEHLENEAITISKSSNKMDPKRMDFLKKSEPTKSTDDIQKKKDSPGKLKHNIYINVNALMPGVPLPWKKDSSGSTLSKSKSLEESQESEKDDVPEKICHTQSCKDVRTTQGVDGDNDVETLHSITKNRARIQTKRKPSTRRARQASIKKHSDEGKNTFVDDSNKSSSTDTFHNDNSIISSENNNPEDDAQSTSKINNNISALEKLDNNQIKSAISDFKQNNYNKQTVKVGEIEIPDNTGKETAGNQAEEKEIVVDIKPNEKKFVIDNITRETENLINSKLQENEEDKTKSVISKQNTSSSLFDELSDDSDSDIFNSNKQKIQGANLLEKSNLAKDENKTGLLTDNQPNLFNEKSLFEDSKRPVLTENTSKVIAFVDDIPSGAKSKVSLFDDDEEDDLFAGKDARKSKADKSTEGNIFKDDDIFAPKTVKIAPVAKKKGSLFDDLSEDEDIFGSGSTQKNTVKSINTSDKKQARNKTLLKKSEERTVVNDPLDAMSNNF